MTTHPQPKNSTGNGDHPKTSRRRFLLLASQVGAVFAIGGGLAWQRRARFLRPPGAGSEVDFLAMCSACNRCVEACPQNVLARVKSSEDISSVGTPRLDFTEGYCDFCGDCIEVCPTGAISAAAPTATTLGVAAIARDMCISWDWGACNRCVAACPEGAIIVDESSRPIVDAERCTGCGACEAVCDRSAKRLDTNHTGKAIVVSPITSLS
jgi:ferredoxin-type protein NapG